MPMAWLRKSRENCCVGVLIWSALDRWVGMWQSMQDVIIRAPIAMALRTRDAQLVRARVRYRAAIACEREGCAMTFQTSREDDSSKVDRAIRVTGTVDPLLRSGQIGNRQFEQQPVLPVEICLPSSPGPDHQIDALGPRPRLERVDAGLIEGAIPPVHREIDARRPRAQPVVSPGIVALNGLGAGPGGGVKVSGANEAVDDRLVARLARGGLLDERICLRIRRSAGGRDDPCEQAENEWRHRAGLHTDRTEAVA